jgi:hypothetical protein
VQEKKENPKVMKTEKNLLSFLKKIFIKLEENKALKFIKVKSIQYKTCSNRKVAFSIRLIYAMISIKRKNF